MAFLQPNQAPLLSAATEAAHDKMHDFDETTSVIMGLHLCIPHGDKWPKVRNLHRGGRWELWDVGSGVEGKADKGRRAVLLYVVEWEKRERLIKSMWDTEEKQRTVIKEVTGRTLSRQLWGKPNQTVLRRKNPKMAQQNTCHSVIVCALWSSTYRWHATSGVIAYLDPMDPGHNYGDNCRSD